MTDREIRVENGVVFGSGGGRDLLCDIYTPPGAANAAAVLLLYGGGWRMGERGRMRDHGMALAGRGFVAVASDYRLTPESPWPAQIYDVKAAIRWMRASATRLGIDPGRIAIEGHSAGAHLALLAAGTPGLPAFEGSGGNPGVANDIAAVVAVYPPVRFHVGSDRASGSTPATALMGENATMEDARAAGPIEYAAANFPPTLLLHGSADKVVPPTATLRMYEALSQAGAPVEMHMYANLPHGFARLPSMLGLVQDEIANFLDRHIIDPGRVKREVDQLMGEMAATRTAAAR